MSPYMSFSIRKHFIPDWNNAIIYDNDTFHKLSMYDNHDINDDYENNHTKTPDCHFYIEIFQSNKRLGIG